MADQVFAYGYEIRVLLCACCGAPFDCPVTGGAVRCKYCGTVDQLEARDTRVSATQAMAAMSEGERLALLRTQDGQAWRPPSMTQHLLDADGLLKSELVDEAWDRWQRARAQLRRSGSTEAQTEASEQLHFLTRALQQHLAGLNEHLRDRATIETALELVTDERQRQDLRTMMTTNAVRLGELAAAGQWLATCDARPFDLFSDTAYRWSRALLATAQGEYAVVLQELGKAYDDIPMADAFDRAAAVVRANVHERTGAQDRAVQELVRGFSGLSPKAAARQIDRIIAKNAALMLCPASSSPAKQQLQALATNLVVTKEPPPLPVGWLWLAALAMIAAGLGASYSVKPGIWTAAVAAAALGGLLVYSVVSVLALRALSKQRRNRFVAQSSAGRARVLRLTDVPKSAYARLIELTLEVELPGRVIYHARHRVEAPTTDHASTTGTFEALERARRGAWLPVRVHPSNPALMIVDWR